MAAPPLDWARTVLNDALYIGGTLGPEHVGALSVRQRRVYGASTVV